MEIGNEIKFRKNGIFVDVWNEEQEEWKEYPINDPELNYNFERFLKNIVNFDENLTVRDFMLLLYPYRYKIDKIFEGSNYGYKLDPFYKNMEEEVINKSDVNNIEFYWGVEIFEDEINDYVSYHGFKKGEDQAYSLSLSPIKNWQNAKISLNMNYKIYDYEKSYENPILSTTKFFTLYNIIDGWIDELTYHGYPEEQEDFGKKLEKVSKEIDEGKYETYTIEEIFIKEKAKMLKEAINNEDYEEAEKLKEKIKELNNKKK